MEKAVRLTGPADSEGGSKGDAIYVGAVQSSIKITAVIFRRAVRQCTSRGIATRVGLASCRSLPRPRVPSEREQGPSPGGRWTPPGPSCHSPCSRAAIEQDVIVGAGDVLEYARTLRAIQRDWRHFLPPCRYCCVLAVRGLTPGAASSCGCGGQPYMPERKIDSNSKARTA